jgi:hypothetical protein
MADFEAAPDQNSVADASGLAQFAARLRWAIQDSNLGPLPYQKGPRTARLGTFSLQIGPKAGFV